MNIKFATSPSKNIDLSIIAIDNQFIDSNSSSYLEEKYGVLLDLEHGLGNSPDIFQINQNKKTKQIILIDLSEKYNHHSILTSFLDIASNPKNIRESKIQLDLTLVDRDLVLSPVIQALELASYDLALYQTQKKPSHALRDPKAEITVIMEKSDKEAVIQAQTIAHYQKEVMDLVNAPYNKLGANNLVSWVKDQGRKNRFKVTVFNKAKIEKTGLHALLAVNRGSESDPVFIIAEYKGNKRQDAGTIGLIGKGVTFDTGGLSIKPSSNMHYMKSDMGGAATVLGAISTIAALKWPVNIVTITPVTDNSVDANSIKPGDVIDSYSGKTIEIIDTDAEGRLILADALAYMAKNYEVDHIIDLATLTGSAVRTFGSVCAALLSNDEELADTIYNQGIETGEKVWPLPLWDEYDDEMKSDVADIKNLSTKPVAGAITAAKFLQAFISDHPSWAHLDIAGTAFGDTKFGKMKAATGWGVHLLCSVVKELNG